MIPQKTYTIKMESMEELLKEGIKKRNSIKNEGGNTSIDLNRNSQPIRNSKNNSDTLVLNNVNVKQSPSSGGTDFVQTWKNATKPSKGGSSRGETSQD